MNYFKNLHSLKLTAKAPENRPGPKRKRSYSNHPFSGAMLVSGRVDFAEIMGFPFLNATFWGKSVVWGRDFIWPEPNDFWRFDYSPVPLTIEDQQKITFSSLSQQYHKASNNERAALNHSTISTYLNRKSQLSCASTFCGILKHLNTVQFFSLALSHPTSAKICQKKQVNG